MQVAIVIPCLNEQDHIRETVWSFADAYGNLPPDTDLILVDNGSTDDTWSVLGELVRADARGRVHRLKEEERGYVPPRHRGVVYIRDLAHARAVASEDVLVLQGDADTVYLPGYVDRMRRAAAPNVLLEGSIGRAREDHDLPASYRALELRIDRLVQGLEVEDELETLVDDKACGYLLNDYLAWGGLRREYGADGSELHAETTRLLLRARAICSATRLRVEDAGALTSSRRIWEDPALYFSTAGFPRERSWRDAFHRAAAQPDGPAVQLGEISTATVPAIRLRLGHAVILFAILPRLVAGRLGARVSTPPVLEPIFSSLTACSRADLRDRPGWLIDHLFRLIDEPASPLQSVLDRYLDAAV